MIIPPGCAEVTINWGIATATEPIVNVFGLNGVVTDPESMDAFAADIGGLFDSTVMTILDENVHLDYVDILTSEGWAGHAELFLPGDQTYPCAPPNVTHLIGKRTGYSGRHQNGRLYLPGVDESNVNAGGIIAPLRRAEINVEMENLRDALVTYGCPMVLLHNLDLMPETPVTALQCQTKVATQRRRVR